MSKECLLLMKRIRYIKSLERNVLLGVNQDGQEFAVIVEDLSVLPRRYFPVTYHQESGGISVLVPFWAYAVYRDTENAWVFDRLLIDEAFPITTSINQQVPEFCFLGIASARIFLHNGREYVDIKAFDPPSWLLDTSGNYRIVSDNEGLLKDVKSWDFGYDYYSQEDGILVEWDSINNWWFVSHIENLSA